MTKKIFIRFLTLSLITLSVFASARGGSCSTNQGTGGKTGGRKMKNIKQICIYLIILVSILLNYSACASINESIDFQRYLSAEQHYLSAEQHYANGNYEQAIRDYSEAIRLYPYKNMYNSQYFIGRARAYEQNGDYDNAINDYNEGRRWSHQHIFDRGLFYQHTGQIELAVSDFTAFIESYRDIRSSGFRERVIISYVNRGLLYQQTSNHVLALADFREVLRLDPNNSEAREKIEISRLNVNQQITPIMESANASRDRRDYDTAIAQYRRVLEIDPNNTEAGNNISAIQRQFMASANASRDRQDYDTAIAQYRRVLEIDPNHTEARTNIDRMPELRLFNLANASRDRRDYDTAIAQYREVLALNTNHTGARNNLTVTWNRRIAENAQLYPAPFTGVWFHYNPGSSGTTERYYHNSPTPGARTDNQGRIYTEQHGVGSRLPSYIEIVFYANSNYIISERYTSYTSGRGTFYYNGNRIELDNGTVLEFRNNTIIMGNTILNRGLPTMFN